MNTSKTTQDDALTVNTTKVATVKQVQLRATINCGPWLVLAAHDPTYTQSELAAIKQFVVQRAGSIIGQDAAYHGYDPGTPIKLPSTLRFIPGYDTCNGTYEITNTGTSLVQVNGAGFQMNRPAATFTYDYHLLDACPYLQPCNCGGCGAADPCSFRYGADFQLPLNQSLLMQDFAAGSNSLCPTPINLQPGNTATVYVTFHRPKGDTDPGLWASGVPALDVTLPQGKQTLTYPTLLNNLVLITFTSHGAPPGTCYTQKGTTFTPVAYESTVCF